MANNVFANGLEIACKAADGKSVACFPDVCFSPPSPPAGWIPIPYANTAYAKDTSNASKTVFISGKPVMKKDVSFFKTSTGNEPAAGPKGLISGVKKGKAYFTSWSMNVKIEGKNVDRHSDLTTHNHGSSPNTAPWFYADSSVVGKKCDKEKKKAVKECGKGSSWKKHCKPRTEDKRKAEKKHKKNKLKKKMEAVQKKVVEHTKKISGFTDKIEKAAAKKAATIAVKAGIKGWLGPFGWAWTAYDVYSGVTEINEMWDKLKDMKKSFKKINDEMQQVLKEIKNFDNVAKAILNTKSSPCIRARACILSPYKEAKKACCPGQESHHILPGSAIQKTVGGKKTVIKACPNYKYNDAPGACGWGGAEEDKPVGGLKGGGEEHYEMHKKYKLGANRSYKHNSKRLTLSKAKGRAIGSHIATHPLSRCSIGCLKAQMDAYYDKACPGKEKEIVVIPADGHTKALVPSAKIEGETKSDYN